MTRITLTVEKSEIADLLNNHFESMFIKEPRDPLPEIENRTNVKFGTEREHLQRSMSLRYESLKSLKESK